MNRWQEWTDLGKDLGKSLGNVVRMAPNDGLPQARTLVAQMEAYWSALPRLGAVPRRADVDPRGIEDLLPHSVILERVAPRVARIRIAGQHLNTIAGMEVRGMPISALCDGPGRAVMADATEALFDRPAIFTARLSSAGSTLKRGLNGQMILLPLCQDDGTVARAIGVVVTDARPGDAAQSLSLSDVNLRPLGEVTEAMAPVATSAEAMGFAEAQAPLSGRPHLRLVHSVD